MKIQICSKRGLHHANRRLKQTVNSRLYSVAGWGNGLSAQLGLGQTVDVAAKPLQVPNFANLSVKQLQSGVKHSVALVHAEGKGKLFTWGSNDYCQAGYFSELETGVGLFDTEEKLIEEPMQLRDGAELLNFKQIAVGDFHNLALTQDGKVFAWGGGILGYGSELFEIQMFPVKKLVDCKVDAVYASGNTSLAVIDNNGLKEIMLWGYLDTSTKGDVKKSLEPARLLLGDCPFQWQEINSVAINQHNLAISGTNIEGKQEVHVFGSLNNITPGYVPYCPEFQVDAPVVADSVTLPSLLSKNKDKVTLHSVFEPSQEPISFAKISGVDSPISNMYVRKNSAIFSTPTEVLTYSAIPPVKKEPGSILSIFFTTKEEKEINPRPLIDTILTTPPDIQYINDAQIVSCGWDFFIVSTN
ncbi:Regulator of chromosome condensation [Terramyces sp. JEL0728]|nr:Regulator of chromosome condensation [Terramyces sp. JEL0728]